MKNIAMSNIVAKPHGVFFSFFKKKIYSQRETPPPPCFHWNLLLDMVKHYYFVWSNIVLSKFKKEGVEIIQGCYLNLSRS